MTQNVCLFFIYEDNKSRVMDKDNVVVCIFPFAILGHLTETKTKITYLQVITTKTKTIYKYYFPPKTKTKLLSNILSRNSTITNSICLMLTKTTLP